jgi:multicomponent Na+:H+ antiporter subunit D
MPDDPSTTSILPLVAILVSMLVVPAILLSGRRPNLREGWTFAAAGVKFICVLLLLPAALRGASTSLTLFELAPGVGLSLVADPLGVYFALVASGLWIVTSVYSIGYMRGHGEKKQTRFFASFALSLSATIGVAFAGNLLTFILFYELLTLATYPLVVHKESPQALRSARMYLAYALTAGLLLVVAAGWIFARTGTLDFAPGGIIAEGVFSDGELKVLFMLLITGVGVKAGIMPLHSWLPAAMVAPTPVSALLHAVAVVKSGAFGILRVVGFIFGPALMSGQGLDVILAGFAGATILLASIMALRQDNLKKRLAYSTIGHLSYIALGAALLAPGALTGSILHLSAHAVMKITLFFCAGAIQVHAHRSEISSLNGLGRAMPWTFGAFAIGSLGLAGIPPVNGFISKWWLCLGSIESGRDIALGVFLLSGLLNAAYFFPIVIRAFFLPPDAAGDAHPVRGEASPWMVAPLCVTATLAVVFGLFPDFPLPFFELAKGIVESIVTGSSPSPAG